MSPFQKKKRAKSLGIVAVLTQLTTHGFQITRREQYLAKRFSRVDSYAELKKQGSTLFRLLTEKTRQWGVPPLRPATSFLKLRQVPEMDDPSLKKAKRSSHGKSSTTVFRRFGTIYKR